MPKKKCYAVAKGHKAGISETWAACQKATKGFKGAKFRSFNTKKLAMEWFDSKANNKELNENLVGRSKETGEMLEGKTKHCINACTFNEEDEKKDEMIECCLCKRWYQTKCVTPEKREPKRVKASNKEGQDESESSQL